MALSKSYTEMKNISEFYYVQDIHKIYPSIDLNLYALKIFLQLQLKNLKYKMNLLWVFVASEREFSSVFYRYYFTLSSTTNTTQFFTITWKKWNMTQRTLKNKQFNIDNKTGVKINEKLNGQVAFVMSC